MEGLQATNAYDHLMKILIIGDSGSSKRRLLAKYLRDEELTDTTTLGEYIWPGLVSSRGLTQCDVSVRDAGLDYKLKDVVHRSKAIKLQLW